MKKAGRPVSPMLGAAAGCWQGWGQAGICGGVAGRGPWWPSLSRWSLGAWEPRGAWGCLRGSSPNRGTGIASEHFSSSSFPQSGGPRPGPMSCSLLQLQSQRVSGKWFGGLPPQCPLVPGPAQADAVGTPSQGHSFSWSQALHRETRLQQESRRPCPAQETGAPPCPQALQLMVEEARKPTECSLSVPLVSWSLWLL